MKKRVLVVEGKSDEEIIKWLLEGIPEARFRTTVRVAGSSSGATSLARTLLFKFECPTAIVVDSQDPDDLESLETYFAAAPEGLEPVEVLAARPSLEAIFFESPRVIEALAGREPSPEEAVRARFEPRETLQELLKGEPLQDAILRLTEEEHSLVQHHEFVKSLKRFVGVDVDATETILSVKPEALRHLREVEAVEVLRKILWAEIGRLGLPVTDVTVSLETKVADGGADGWVEIKSEVPSDTFLTKGHTAFQVKAGASFRPWRESDVLKELWGKRTKDADGLGSETLRCLEAGGTFVLVTFGHDLLSKQRVQATSLLQESFSKCGFKDAAVEVLGVGQLLAMVSRHPSLGFELNGRTELKARTFETWSSSANMLSAWFPGAKHEAMMQRIRDALRQREPLHVRVSGEPGIGKTRLVLEAIRSAPDLASRAVYFAYAEEFRRSQLLREIIRPDSELHAILVLDECSSRDRTEVWDYLRPLRARVGLVTLSHEPDRSRDEAAIDLVVPPLEDDQVEKILDSYHDSDRDQSLHRWVSLCEGSPRVAHMIGQNLQLNPEEILAPPSTNSVWERFVVGADDSASERVRRRWLVLRFIALFRRFGYRDPVAQEGQTIAKLIEKASNVSEAAFHEAVSELRERRILQGLTTLRIVPRALHVHLWLQWWDTYGSTFDYTDFVSQLAGNLPRWFSEMFIYAGSSDQAQRTVQSLLDPRGLGEDLLATEPGASFFRALAEACPEAALRFLERTVGEWEPSRVGSFGTGRRQVVWALEGIVVWRELFPRAARILLRLAEHETETYGNNATGTFVSLFAPAPGSVSMTEAPPSERLPVLREVLLEKGHSQTARKIAIDACGSALRTGGFSRMLGSEQQGLRPGPELWWPATYGEFADAYRGVWRLLAEVWETAIGDLRQQAFGTMADHAPDLLTLFGGLMAEEVVETIRSLSADPSNKRRLISTILNSLNRSNLPDGVEGKLREIHDALVGDTVSDQIRRYVGMNLREDTLLSDLSYAEAEKRLLKKLEELAAACLAEPDVFESLLPWLVSRDPERPVHFGHALARQPDGGDLLPQVLEAQDSIGPEGSLGLLSGFFRALRQTNVGEWESKLDELAQNSSRRSWVSEITWRSGQLTENAARRVLSLAQDGAIPATDFGFWRWGSDLQQLPKSLFQEWIILLLNVKRADATEVALDLIRSYLHDKENLGGLPADLIEELLHRTFSLPEARDRGMLHHNWSELTRSLLADHPQRALPLLSFCLSEISQTDERLSHNTRGEVLREIFRDSPREAWGVVSKHLDDVWSSQAYEIMHWLRGDLAIFNEDVGRGDLGLVPRDVLWSWVDKNVEDRANFIARYVPKTLGEEGGDLTRDLLVRYGDREDVQGSLLANFGSTGWTGSAAEHYRRLRLRAEGWRDGEADPSVLRWLDQYLESLNRDIARSEVDEERGR